MKAEIVTPVVHRDVVVTMNEREAALINSFIYKCVGDNGSEIYRVMESLHLAFKDANISISIPITHSVSVGNIILRND